jgi:hypothetical protein
MNTLNELIKARAEVKTSMDDLAKQTKILQQAKDELDYNLIQRLEEQGLSRTATDEASVSINTSTVPDVVDWDAFYEFIFSTKDSTLLQRRPSSTAYKEFLKMGIEVPGLQPREVKRINFRNL